MSAINSAGTREKSYLLREHKKNLDRLLHKYINEGKWYLAMKTVMSGADAVDIKGEQSCDVYKEQHRQYLQYAIKKIRKKMYHDALAPLETDIKILFYTLHSDCRLIDNLNRTIQKSLKLYEAVENKLEH